MELVYIETTIVSYLVANPSRDLVLAAHQEVTRRWWREQRENYGCVTSDEVLREASMGDAEMSRQRIAELAGVNGQLLDEKALVLVQALVGEQILPPDAFYQAICITVAHLQALASLLRLNSRHMAD